MLALHLLMLPVHCDLPSAQRQSRYTLVSACLDPSFPADVRSAAILTGVTDEVNDVMRMPTLPWDLYMHYECLCRLSAGYGHRLAS